ncbi:DUF808 domain-containing protein [Pusillimonas sp.]|uniref:DUF808 domain-containing protein n=1 Tax=Pusillimonas sp. TaxID=3040095 RepID=UPI0029A363F0|nr:DUF808 domain-containing protein [Pusillimonas sp.]MDX3893282.1 DUF808 domain-containing protein [Pusillimonas sp.]
MAGAGLLMLLDDITTILDDVAAMTKLAGKKTAGMLGDDIALNAEQVSGMAAKRELPVVWAVAKGSFLNKLILVPLALLVSAILPAVITPLLMVGGLFLCYEGAEKIVHTFSGSRHKAKAEGGEQGEAEGYQQSAAEARRRPASDEVRHEDADADQGRHVAEALPAQSAQSARAQGEPASGRAGLDPAALRARERTKIKGAIRTDFILSAEIVAVTLGTVASAPFTSRALVVSVVAVILTIAVYGLVATVVKLDDVGSWLLRHRGETIAPRAARAAGRGVLAFAPYVMRGLSIAGTAAMFLVGGGLLIHGIAPLQGWVHHAFHHAANKHPSLLEAAASYLGPALVSVATGVVAGMVVYGVLTLLQRFRG